MFKKSVTGNTKAGVFGVPPPRTTAPPTEDAGQMQMQNPQNSLPPQEWHSNQIEDD